MKGNVVNRIDPVSALFRGLFVLALALMLFGAMAKATDLRPVTYDRADFSPQLLTWVEIGPRYLPRDFDTGVTDFPANDSVETRDELAALLAAQETLRTPETVALIEAEHSAEEVAPLIFAVNGLALDAMPVTRMILGALDYEVGALVVRDKLAFLRPRPSMLEPRLTTLFPDPPHASYPSGHAAQAMAAALMLGILDESRKSLYEDEARAIGYRREVAGVHFASDTAAGQVAAAAIVAGLMANPSFADKVEKARAEWKDNTGKKPE